MSGATTRNPAAGERFDLEPPAVPELREAVQQEDERPLSGLDVVQLHVADVGVALTDVAAQEFCRLLAGSPVWLAVLLITILPL